MMQPLTVVGAAQDLPPQGEDQPMTSHAAVRPALVPQHRAGPARNHPPLREDTIPMGSVHASADSIEDRTLDGVPVDGEKKVLTLFYVVGYTAGLAAARGA